MTSGTGIALGLAVGMWPVEAGRGRPVPTWTENGPEVAGLLEGSRIEEDFHDGVHGVRLARIRHLALYLALRQGIGGEVFQEMERLAIRHDLTPVVLWDSVRLVRVTLGLQHPPRDLSDESRRGWVSLQAVGQRALCADFLQRFPMARASYVEDVLEWARDNKEAQDVLQSVRSRNGVMEFADPASPHWHSAFRLQGDWLDRIPPVTWSLAGPSPNLLKAVSTPPTVVDWKAVDAWVETRPVPPWERTWMRQIARAQLAAWHELDRAMVMDEIPPLNVLRQQRLKDADFHLGQLRAWERFIECYWQGDLESGDNPLTLLSVPDRR